MSRGDGSKGWLVRLYSSVWVKVVLVFLLITFLTYLYVWRTYELPSSRVWVEPPELKFNLPEKPSYGIYVYDYDGQQVMIPLCEGSGNGCVDLEDMMRMYLILPVSDENWSLAYRVRYDWYLPRNKKDLFSLFNYNVSQDLSPGEVWVVFKVINQTTYFWRNESRPVYLVGMYLSDNRFVLDSFKEYPTLGDEHAGSPVMMGRLYVDQRNGVVYEIDYQNNLKIVLLEIREYKDKKNLGIGN